MDFLFTTVMLFNQFKSNRMVSLFKSDMVSDFFCKFGVE